MKFMKIKNIKFALVLMGFMLFITAANAQVTTSSMSGHITDADGTILVGAIVSAVHTPTGTNYYATADAYGNFRIPNMRTGGPYTVTISLMGYSKKEYQNINLSLGDNYILNPVLQEESVGLDAIVVTADGTTSNMRSDRAGAITTMNLAEINGTPTVTRSLNDVLKATPQLFVSSNGLQIGGGSYRQSFVTVDGAAFNNAFGIGQNLPAGGSPISLDALEQISVSITPYDVRQSGFIGGSINAVTRSGDNEFRGSAYMYYSNESLRGKKVGSTKLTVNDATEQLFGMRIGGPIIKNKLFFFVSGELTQNTVPGSSRIPSTPDRPYSTGTDNVARPSENAMNAIGNYLVDNYNYNPGPYADYSAESPGYKILARVDWNINRDHKLNFRYSLTKSKSPKNPSTSTGGLGNQNFSPTTRTAMDAIFFANARYYEETNFSSYAGELNSRFLDGALTNIFRVSYSHQDEPRSTDGRPFPFVDISAGSGNNIYTSFGTELFSFGNLRDVKTLNITDELSATIGMHNLLAGVQFEHNTTKNGFQRFGSGYYQFAFADENALLAAINGQTLFDDPAQFAITHSMKEGFGQEFPTFKFNQFSLYFQDEISFNERFKLQAGIRFELPLYPDLDTYNKQVAGIQFAPYKGNNGHYDTRELPETKIMLSPRIGFNWDLTGDRTLVLRGGTGLFTGRIPFVWIVAQAGDSGVLQTTYTAVKGDGKTIPVFTDDRMAMLNEIYPNGLNAQVANIRSVTLMADDLKMPQAWKSSLALDARLPFDILASVEGIYTKDINPVTVTNVGLKEPVSSAIPNYADNRLYYGTRYNSTLRDAYLLHNLDSNDGYYYSITGKLEKNNWYGLSAMMAYTYSRAENYGDGWGDQVSSAYQNAVTVNGQNVKELGFASYVMPHRLIGSLHYRKEYAKHFATGISLFYEGGPQGRMSYTYTSNVLGDGGSYNLLYVPYSQDELSFADYTYRDSDNVTQVYTAAQQAEDFWNFINNDDYLKNRKGKYAERNGVVYPWSHQFDIKITQDFYLNAWGSKHTLQLGFDILNVGNLLNKNWGHKYYYNRNAILSQVGNGFGQGSTGKPVYNFQRAGTEVLKDAFRSDNSLSSTYYMQISIRYIFN
jgi:outer membrane receptor for ferrienterochelin and colicin